jgi:hypothetical protein
MYYERCRRVSTADAICTADWRPAAAVISSDPMLERRYRAPLAIRFVATVFAFAAIAKCSSFLPDFIAAVSQRGFRPRPAHVSEGLSGLRYLGATRPRGPPRFPFNDLLPLEFICERLLSLASSDRRSSATLALSAASILPLRSINLSTDIDLRGNGPAIAIHPLFCSALQLEAKFAGRGYIVLRSPCWQIVVQLITLFLPGIPGSFSRWFVARRDSVRTALRRSNSGRTKPLYVKEY